jgi:hypothetical protein
MVSFLATNVHVITTSFAGITNIVHATGLQLKSYHDAFAFHVTVTLASYLYDPLTGNSLAQFGTIHEYL